MLRNQISSEDIRLNVFVKNKFADNAIRSHHISDASISDIKVGDHQLKHDHFVTNIVDSSKIMNGQLTADHVPLSSIPLSRYADTFSIAAGGTGKTVFDNYGVLYSTSVNAFETNINVLKLKDEYMGIGGEIVTTQSIALKEIQMLFSQPKRNPIDCLI